MCCLRNHAEMPHKLAQNLQKHKNPLPLAEAHWKIGSISVATGTKVMAVIN